MEKINIAELLKNCPKGMELDCSVWDNVVFDHIDTTSNYPIYIKKMGGELEYLTEDGHFNFDCDAKCVIFPKGKTTWEGFVPPCKFKDGDVLAFDDETIVIFKDLYNNTSFHSYCHIEDGIFTISKEDMPDWWRAKGFYPATEEQCTLLFRKIKEAGYHWNPETKTLEKLIEPKFKVGDIIRDITGICKVKIAEVNVENRYYLYKSLNINGLGIITFNRQDDWELVPTKFDITTLVPFESRVLVRDHELHKWHPAMWGYYDCDSQDYPYKLVGSTTRYRISYEGKDAARYCIPYEGNEHLLGTTNDCDEYYKTWE